MESLLPHLPDPARHAANEGRLLPHVPAVDAAHDRGAVAELVRHLILGETGLDAVTERFFDVKGISHARANAKSR